MIKQYWHFLDSESVCVCVCVYVCMCELPQHFVVVYGGKKCEGGMGSLNTSQNVCGLQALLQHFYLTNHIYMYIYLELNKAITFSKCLMCGLKDSESVCV